MNRAWEWIKKKWDAVKARISTDKENSNVAINENEQQINSKSTEELKLSASRVSNRIPQNDLRPDKPNGPCLFRSLLAAIEEKIGKAYELNEIDDIAKICWNENNKYLGDADDKYTVINPTKILETALSYSGYKNAKIIYSVRSSSISGNSDYSIRFIKAKNHFQLGDSNGNLLWEPYKYNNESNSFKGKADLYNEITMTLGEKTDWYSHHVITGINRLIPVIGVISKHILMQKAKLEKMMNLYNFIMQKLMELFIKFYLIV